MLDVAGNLGASFFEITTAAAFLAFARTPADACIVEVGLGGRLDATNVIPAPAVCGIAALGIDHEAFLLAPEDGAPGDPMTRIAWEKAGIAKAGTPLVTQTYAPVMAQAIVRQTRSAGAPLFGRGDSWDAGVRDRRLHYNDTHGSLDLPLPALPGAHQADNAALAVAVLRHQDALTVSTAALAEGIVAARWPARLQRLDPGPLTALLPGCEIWLDGGHNASAGEALGNFVVTSGGPIHLVIGMLANKNPDALLQHIAQGCASITVVPVPGHESHSAAAFDGRDTAVGTASDVEVALVALAPSKPRTVLIAGSLYLAGDVLRRNGQIPL